LCGACGCAIRRHGLNFDAPVFGAIALAISRPDHEGSEAPRPSTARSARKTTRTCGWPLCLHVLRLSSPRMRWRVGPDAAW